MRPAQSRDGNPLLSRHHFIREPGIFYPFQRNINKETTINERHVTKASLTINSVPEIEWGTCQHVPDKKSWDRDVLITRRSSNSQGGRTSFFFGSLSIVVTGITTSKTLSQNQRISVKANDFSIRHIQRRSKRYIFDRISLSWNFSVAVPKSANQGKNLGLWTPSTIPALSHERPKATVRRHQVMRSP